MISGRALKVNVEDSCGLLFGEVLVNLFNTLPLFVGVVNEEEEDVLAVFVVVMPPSSAETDLLVMDGVLNGYKPRFS